MIYAVQVLKTGDWYIVEEKTPGSCVELRARRVG